MKQYRIRETGKIVTEQEYRDMYPTISFSIILNPEDADLIYEQAKPKITKYQTAVQDKVIFINNRWEFSWRVEEWDKDDIDADIENIALLELLDFKRNRATIVENIIVSVNGKSFNGDEVSQNRIARAIVAMQATNATEQRWTLADNRNVVVTLAELIEVLSIAGQAQTKVWTR